MHGCGLYGCVLYGCGVYSCGLRDGINRITILKYWKRR